MAEGEPDGLLLTPGLLEARLEAVTLGLIEEEGEREGVLLPEDDARGDLEGVALVQVVLEGGMGDEEAHLDPAPAVRDAKRDKVAFPETLGEREEEAQADNVPEAEGLRVGLAEVHTDPDTEGHCDPDLDGRGEREGRGEVEGVKDAVFSPVPVPPPHPRPILPEGVLDPVRVGKDAVPLFVGSPGVPEGLVDREGEVLKDGEGEIERDGRGEGDEVWLNVLKAVLDGEGVAVTSPLMVATTDTLRTGDPELKRGEGEPEGEGVNTLVASEERVGERETVVVPVDTGQRLDDIDAEGLLDDTTERVPPTIEDPVGATDTVTDVVVD